ncbi:MAG: alpha/beta hydrolase-fold protein [Gemmataceae bacterium]
MGTWTSQNISGRLADCFTPSQQPRFVLLDLHPLSGRTLATSDVFTALLQRYALACVCPHGGECWWGDRPAPLFEPPLTPERYLFQAVLPWIADRWGFRPPAIGLSGISMGGQGALRLAFKYPDRFPVVAAIAPAIEYHQWYGRGGPLDAMYDSKEQARQDTAIMHVHPNRFPPHIFFCTDPADYEWWRGADRLHEKLRALGVPHVADLTTQAGGHSWDYFQHQAERAIGFLVAGLEQQARRLL